MILGNCECVIIEKIFKVAIISAFKMDKGNLTTSSTTEKGRKKVVLKPGHSLMNWVNLSNSGKDMSGTGGAFLNINPGMLAQHNSPSDAWMSINGIVFNVTDYIPFHPGGEDELMRGAGTDATKLFNEIHRWVNYESLLRRCIVGKLNKPFISFCSPSSSQRGGENSLMRISNKNDDDCDKTVKNTVPCDALQPSTFDNLIISKPRAPVLISRIDWYQQINSLCIIFHINIAAIKLFRQHVFVRLLKKNQLYVCIDNNGEEIMLENDVKWPCTIKVLSGKIEIQLTKCEPSIWAIYGTRFSSPLQTEPFYCTMNVSCTESVTHNTKLIVLQYSPEFNNLHFINIGHHVKIRLTIEGEIIERAYTPVPLLTDDGELPSLCNDFNSSDQVRFLIKDYKNGSLSERLCSCVPSEILEMSAPVGSFDINFIPEKFGLLLLAAGTGITPMLSVIVWALHRNVESPVKLVFFNKTEQDIIWKGKLEALQAKNHRFTVKHVLSEADASCKGITTGFITKELLMESFTPVDSNTTNQFFICICGPDSFLKLCRRKLGTNQIIITVSRSDKVGVGRLIFLDS